MLYDIIHYIITIVFLSLKYKILKVKILHTDMAERYGALA